MTAPEYTAARRALLDALGALERHRESLVLIGSQAIYLRTGDAFLTVPPMTTDADLAIDADSLADDPDLAHCMRTAGFVPHGNPGHWLSTDGVYVDLMVAPHHGGRSSSQARGARLPPHAKNVARIAPGLACAVTDHSWMTVRSLDASDARAIDVRVAGAASLLVAKVIKVEERLGDVARGQAGRFVDKDALDLFRILQAVETDELVAGLRGHDTDSAAWSDVDRAVATLADDRNGNRRLGRLAASVALDDPTVAPSFDALVTALLHAWDARPFV